MLSVVHQFISNDVCIRLALSCHILFPTGSKVLWLLQTMVSPEIAPETEQVSHFSLSVFPFSPAGGSGAEAMP